MYTLHLKNLAKQNLICCTTSNAPPKFDLPLTTQLPHPVFLYLCLLFSIALTASSKVALSAEYKLPPGHTLSFVSVNTDAHTSTPIPGSIPGSIHARGPLGEYTRVRLFHKTGPRVEGKQGLMRAIDLWFDGAPNPKFNKVVWTDFRIYLKANYLNDWNMGSLLFQLYNITDLLDYQTFLNEAIKPALQAGFQEFKEEHTFLYPDRANDLRSMELRIGLYEPTYNGMLNLQLLYGKTAEEAPYDNWTHQSRGPSRTITEPGITTKEFERLVNVISELEDLEIPAAESIKNSLLYNDIIQDNPQEYQELGLVSESARLTTHCANSPAAP